MRVLIYILIGLLSGALLTSMLMNTLGKSSAYRKGVMAVEGAHMSALSKLEMENRCTSAEIQPHLITMRIVASDIEPSFKPMSEKDLQFVRYAGDLRRALDLQLAKQINNCADLAAGLSDIKRTCENCHRDYK